jgi:hypothetical protein
MAQRSTCANSSTSKRHIKPAKQCKPICSVVAELHSFPGVLGCSSTPCPMCANPGIALLSDRCERSLFSEGGGSRHIAVAEEEQRKILICGRGNDVQAGICSVKWRQ